MKVLHFILNKGNCRNCGKIVKAKVTKEHQSGYDPRLSALIAEISGIQGNNV
jgi:transposase